MTKENKEWLPFRIIGGIIIGITLTMMFIIKPADGGSPVDTNTLWDAVHPFHPVWDSIALAGLIFFALYVTGLAGKIVYNFVNEKNLNIHIVGIGSTLLTLLFLV